MTRYFEPLVLKVFADFDPSITDKKTLEGYLRRVRAALMGWHKDLKHANELEAALINDRIEAGIGLAKKIKWRLSQAERPKHDEKFYEKLQHAKSVNITLLLPNPIKGKRTDCPFCTGKSNLTMMIGGNFVWCFRCNKGWDNIGLIQEFTGCSFLEAIEKLWAY